MVLCGTDVDEFLLITKPRQSVGEMLADPDCFHNAPAIAIKHHQVLPNK